MWQIVKIPTTFEADAFKTWKGTPEKKEPETF